MIRRLKKNQAHGCDYCRKAGIKRPAKWRGFGFSAVACDEHKQRLIEVEPDAEEHYTEADYQTWLRL